MVWRITTRNTSLLPWANLQNVLDTHTNKLFEQAAEYYKTRPEKLFRRRMRKKIIKLHSPVSLKLTKVVPFETGWRWQRLPISGTKKYTSKEVGLVLNIFREPGNTFVRPFITDASDSQTLRDDDVLDITHESLIRNWEYWKPGQKNLIVYCFTGFWTATNRWWKQSQTDSCCPLASSPILKIYNTVKPNVHWIARTCLKILPRIRSCRRQNWCWVMPGVLQRSSRKHAVTHRYAIWMRRIAALLVYC